MEVEMFDAPAYHHFSGRLSYFSAGKFNDPLFGDMEATGLIKPALPAAGDTLEPGAVMKLRLRVDQQLIYGDSAAVSEFDLVEIGQVWRGKAWNIDEPVALSGEGPVGSFSVGTEDSVDVTLSDTWYQEYRSFFENEAANRDSLYRIEFAGLAVVPRDSSKIIPVRVQESRFIIQNPNEDTLSVAPADWAYSLQRANQGSVPSETFPFHSTLERVISFDNGLTREDLGTVNISKVELVLYEDTERLSTSMDQVALSAGRPEFNLVRLHLIEPGGAPVNLDPGAPLLNGLYNEDDGTFRINLTNFVNGVLLDGLPSDLKFFVTLESNNGIVRSSLIFNKEAARLQRPKLIVTSVQNEEGTN